MKNKIRVNSFKQKTVILLFSLFCFFNIVIADAYGKELVPLGEVVGITVNTKGVCVVNSGDFESDGKNVSPAKEAGILPGDMLLKINGEDISSASKLEELTEKYGSEEITISLKRNGEEKEVRVKPLKDVEDKFKIGVFIKDFECGIGTLTFFDPETGEFGALGHGISNADSCLTEIKSGEVSDADITTVEKGERGMPGEIVGIINEQTKSIGTVTENKESGVFGKLNSEITENCVPVETAGRDKVERGNATILTEVSQDGIKEYSIEIIKTNEDENNRKGMVIEITDNRLLEKTGGIVQGMSGSPIIQNGKLIGAVTHVFVNDPTKGYGIFIDDMLKK